MKPLEISKKQKDQLIEICETLFPEYNLFWFLHENESDTCRIVLAKTHTENIIENGIHINKGCIKGIPDSFHWFEFVMTHLAEKILNPKKPARNQKEIFCNFFWETNINWYYKQQGSLPVSDFYNGAKHPIDYLYNEFLKIKNETKIDKK